MPPMERTGNIDVFNGSFAPTTVPGGFVDSFGARPPELVPFNVQDIGGKVYVTYAPAGHRRRQRRLRAWDWWTFLMKAATCSSGW